MEKGKSLKVLVMVVTGAMHFRIRTLGSVKRTDWGISMKVV